MTGRELWSDGDTDLWEPACDCDVCARAVERGLVPECHVHPDAGVTFVERTSFGDGRRAVCDECDDMLAVEYLITRGE